MKPRTKIQKEIVGYHKKVSDISRKDIDYIKEKAFPHKAYVTQKKITCLRCNHIWENDMKPNSMILKIIGETCPSCNTKLMPLEGRKRTNSQVTYFTKIDTYKGYQLVRIFYISRDLKAGEENHWHISEVIQHWIRGTDGKHQVMTAPYNGFGYGFTDPSWSFGPMEIKHVQDKFRIQKNYIPGRKTLAIIKRNGYNGNFQTLNPVIFFKAILRMGTKSETLLKMKQYDLFVESAIYNLESIYIFWKQIKIAVRSEYIIENARDWFDHLRLLREFGKDINSPKYICPRNFKREHQRYIDKQRRIIEKEKIEKLKKTIDKENKFYIERINKFLDIDISVRDLTIRVIPDVKDFFREGHKLRHCIYSNEYYKENDSLIFSARIGIERVETVQFSLSRMQVVQSRGRFNQFSEHHQQIIKLVNDNAKLIKKAM